MTKRIALNILLAVVAMNTMTACLVERQYDDDYRFDDDRSTTTTTTTTTTTDDRCCKRDTVVEETVVEEETTVVVEEEEEAFIPAFRPVMASTTAELIDHDDYYETSWQSYTMNFTDLADTRACNIDMARQSAGSVVTLSLYGLETHDEVAACPVGRYDIVPDCSLHEGEACMSIHYRDNFGESHGQEFATYGHVDVSLVYSEYVGEPHRCVVSTFVNGSRDMSFTFENYFESYELSPFDGYSDTICTM